MDHDEARQLAETEYQRLVDVLGGLEANEWNRSTDCPGWDLKAMAGHLLGMMELTASQEEGQRQQKAAGEAAHRTGVTHLDALTALQVAEHAHLSPAELVAATRATMPAALAGRFGTTVEQRALPYVAGPPFNEEWTLGYLLETILTRDPWMHRVDMARATGKSLDLTPEHDGRIIADVVEEWGRRHGQPLTLKLTGPAGGTYSAGGGGEEISLDAVEFCRILSGRATGEGLLAQIVPF